MAKRLSLPLAAMAALLVAVAPGCGRTPGPVRPWPLSTDPVVFLNEFTGAVEFQAFGNSRLDALGTDTAEQYDGSGCLKIAVPGPGAGYAGGAFVAREARDLTGYNALTFWAKASRATTMDVAGLGNDNTGTSRYEASTSSIALTTTWRSYTIPIPSPARMAAERGMFFFAASPQSGAGYTLWLDEIRFEQLPTIANPRPVMTPRTLDWFVGTTLPVTGTQTTFAVGATDVLVQHAPGYFDYLSSSPSVATVAAGVLNIVGEGTTTVTATLAGTPVTGAVTLNAAPFAPGMAPVPSLPAGDVISLFSDAYSNAIVDKWSADWDVADVTDLAIDGQNYKLYRNLSFAGIEFISRTIDATAMTHVHLDVWLPSGNLFRVKLVDFGADGVFGGADDSQHELSFTSASTPPLATGTWVGLEIPLASFTGLTARGHLAQLILSGDSRTLYLDNVYFHR